MTNKPKDIGTTGRADLAERFWRRVDKSGDSCWEWTGYRRVDGYGEIGLGARGAGVGRTHRVAWELTHGAIPDGMFVCHKCDNRGCVRPDHLFLGTNADNVADMVAKGRSARGVALPQTRLTDEQVAALRADVLAGESQSSAARRYGVTQGYVSTLVARVYRKDVTG